jgi:periplasmic protein TonB
LLCRVLLRNIFLISGVVISHLLIFLRLLSSPLGGEEFSTQASLTVSLLGDRANFPSLKKSTTTPQINSSPNKENSSLIQDEGDFSSIDGEGMSQSASGTARRAVHSPKPHYPLASRRLREQGLVVVKLCVNEQGIVGEVGLSKSSGFHNLDQSALKALSQWRFTPTISNSTNFFSQCFQTPVQFTLEG